MAVRWNVMEQLADGRASNAKRLAVLIDPDNASDEHIERICGRAVSAGVDFVFLGGSLVSHHGMGQCIRAIREACHLPIVLFPGSPLQVHGGADALLLLSLISGRNADLLIGRHVEAATIIKSSGLEVLPTGYMLVESGRPTTASYISATAPMPADKPQIAACTALAGEMLGLKLMYLDGGSGAQNPVSAPMISAVRKAVDCPLIVGGGMRNARQIETAWQAGADVAVVGNVLETDPQAIAELAMAMRG